MKIKNTVDGAVTATVVKAEIEAIYQEIVNTYTTWKNIK
jgi:hypothetical protein